MAKPRARTLNLKGRSIARASHFVARNVFGVDVQTLPCRQLIDGSGYGRKLRVGGRKLRVGGRKLRVYGRGCLRSRFTVSYWVAISESRVAGRGSVVRTPHYRRAERHPFRQRISDLHRFRSMTPFRSTQVVVGLRGTALLLHHLGHFWHAQRDLVPKY